MQSKIIAFGLIALTAAAVAYYPTVHGTPANSGGSGTTPLVQPIQISAPTHRTETAKIEVVFVLDTTGSMSSLIQAAKDKIWSIASTMASAQPAPEISMGLVAYRDRGDAYVTRVVDLSDDLDSMYATLIDFQADGGGDGPESVNQALNDAIHQISWSQDPDSYQVVFLVGDAPPHMDYQDEAQYPAIMAEAARRGIVVNTIRCGNDHRTEALWRDIASATQGDYFTVEQSGSAIAMTTPYDEEIARLAADLDETRLYYGSEEERSEKDLKIAATAKLRDSASEAALARRAAFNVSPSGATNLFGRGDLISDVIDGAVKLDEIEPDNLPQSLRAMSPAELDEVVQTNSERREKLKRQIGELSRERAAYLESEVAALEDKEESLDYQIFETVREQAGKKGLTYSEAPKL